jgi:hypothetical protein
MLLLLPLLFSPLAPARQAAEQDELVKEFKRFYHPRRSPEEKIEAIYVLKEADPLQATEVLVRAFDEQESRVKKVVIETIGSFKDARVVLYLIEKYITNKRERKKHRIATAIECLGLIGDDRALDPMLSLYRRMKAWEVRKAMAEALGRFKSVKGLPLLAEFLQTDDASLRVIAVDALANINAPDASMAEPGLEGENAETCKQAIIRVLEEDEDWQVRASAIQAVRVMRFKEGIQPLIDRMRQEEGRLRQDAFEALREITFTQWGDNPKEWQDYWDRVKERFEVPDINVVMEARKKREQEGGRYSDGTPAFVGIETKSKRIIFVIDVSLSMETEVLDTDRFKERGREYKNYQRLEIVKEELIATVQSFRDNVQFNILSFATNLKWWKKDLVPSNILNRNSAVDFVRRLEPIGGGSTGFKVRAGLRANAMLKEGMTNTYGALMAALGVDEEYEEDAARKSFNEQVDTIYFLSDGEPTVGTIIDQDDIREAVFRVNKVRKVTIHTIAIGDFRKSFLKHLAGDNGGVYVDLGK